MELPDGRTLTVRAVTRADVAALGALYASLTPDDLHSRFFSVFHPSPALFEGWIASAGGAGGFGIVAVTSNGTERIVGEAGYAPLPDGDGELAIAVAPDWRGGWVHTCSTCCSRRLQLAASPTSRPTSCSSAVACWPWPAPETTRSSLTTISTPCGWRSEPVGSAPLAGRSQGTAGSSSRCRAPAGGLGPRRAPMTPRCSANGALSR